MRRAAWIFAMCLCALGAEASARQVIPHHQDRPPNDPYPAEVAAKRMTVPPGFTVEVVASEPMVVNPVAMTIDEKGRFWITESLEYPRRSAGPGRDRIKVLEDTDGDGKVDKATIFAEGLNIPSGIAVGHGGVWVANAPDILFMQDTDGDGKADKTEVVVTGFGRDDTHELPNSLTWGPDGKLYGLNGVFNRSVVEHRGKTFDFTCALFRIDPRTRDFELFAEGTSNPWGVAFNNDGEAFLSACVIDHLWHLTESGYYHRQGGPYPPFTWKIESIVDYTHQKAAYCGITYFDSDAYPPEYREKLYMGNIHGGCINVDAITPQGSTYRGVKQPDFLTANDAWFMPVVQKTGPDGSLYILDWYDRYHCYQDANRDPEGIDRLKGRLYRVRRDGTPRTPPFDLGKESNAKLVERLGSPNVYHRDIAQRLLSERGGSELEAELEGVALDASRNRKQRMHALWARLGAGRPSSEFLLKLMSDADPGFRSWGVRALGETRALGPKLRERFFALVDDPAPTVVLQVAVAAPKFPGVDLSELYPRLLARKGEDLLIRKIVWKNLQDSLRKDHRNWVKAVDARPPGEPSEAAFQSLLPRMIDLLSGIGDAGALSSSARLLDRLAMREEKISAETREALETLARKVGTGEIPRQRVESLRQVLGATVRELLDAEPGSDGGFAAARLGLALGEPAAVESLRQTARSAEAAGLRRLDAAEALLTAGDASLVEELAHAAADPAQGDEAYRRRLFEVVARSNAEAFGEALLVAAVREPGALRPRAIDALTSRPEWARKLVDAVAARKIPIETIDLNQLRRLAASKDEATIARIKKLWGTIREDRNPKREQVIAAMRNKFQEKGGDPVAGKAVFAKVCGQCHKIYGEGQEVGPEITANGRSSFEQLLSNVFDPSLVIGEAYQGTTVATSDGRVLSGLVVEDTPQRIVLKLQGGKSEVIPRSAVDEVKRSKLSLMPEDLEQQINEKEMLDLFSFLVLDKPPGTPEARPLPGTPAALVK